MKTKIMKNNSEVLVEWDPDKEAGKFKRLVKRLDKVGMFNVEDFQEIYRKVDGKEVEFWRRRFECVLSPDHDWAEDVFEALADHGLCPSLVCEGKRRYTACYDDPAEFSSPEPGEFTATTFRGAMKKAYEGWLRAGRYIHGVSLKGLLENFS